LHRFDRLLVIQEGMLAYNGPYDSTVVSAFVESAANGAADSPRLP
jgi:hypothetical protein